MVYDRLIPYNQLPPLPPPATLENDPDILRKLVSASRALATVNSGVLRLPNPFMLINTIALQEAKTSTAIENIFTTEDELYKAVSDTINEGQANLATKEVLRYREALWEGYRRLQQKKQIDLPIIEGIFQQIKNTTTGLRSPQAQVVIRRGDSEFRSGEVIYTPPRGHDVVNALIQNLVTYLNDQNSISADPLLKMCVAHYQFEAIHPFVDGNGRTGRILNLLYLVHQNLLSYPVLYLSKYIINHKEDYYYQLGAVTQRGTWKNWILFMLDAVEKTSVLTYQLIDEITRQMDASLQHGKSNLKWYNKELNEVLFSQPYCKAATVGQVLGKASRTTLSRYMDELVACQLLSLKKDGKQVYYLNNDLIRILES